MISFLVATVSSGLVLVAIMRSMNQRASSFVTATLCGGAAGWALCDRSSVWWSTFAAAAVYFGYDSWRSGRNGMTRHLRAPPDTGCEPETLNRHKLKIVQNCRSCTQTEITKDPYLGGKTP